MTIDRPKKKDTHLQIRLSVELAERWKKVTSAKAINSSELIRQLMEAWLEENEVTLERIKETGDIFKKIGMIDQYKKQNKEIENK